MKSSPDPFGPSGWSAAIEAYAPENDQEVSDRQAVFWFIKRHPDTVLTRQNPIAHITSSGFILNPSLSRALMIHHNIRDCWAWTGGHADGETDLPAVAIAEAREETGAKRVSLLVPSIASIDVLQVFGHVKNGAYVSAHLHLSVAYLLTVPDDEPLRVKPDENTGVRWFDIEEIRPPLFSPKDTAFYQKLIRKARC